MEKETRVASEGGVMQGSVLPRQTTAVMTTHPPRAWQVYPKWGPDLLGVLAAIVVALVLGSRMLGPNVSVPESVVAQFQPFSTIAPQPVRNWIISDVALVMYPNRVFIQRAFAAGQFPLWNPYILNRASPPPPTPICRSFTHHASVWPPLCCTRPRC